MPDEIEKAIYSISTKAYLSQEAKEMVKRGKTQLKQDGVYGINPIDPEFVPATVDRRTVLGMMFLPDITEIQLIVASFFLNLLILAPLLQFNLSSPSFVIFFGFASLSLFAYRWGYAGIAHFASKQQRIMEEIAGGKLIVLELKLFGLVLSILTIILGYQL